MCVCKATLSCSSKRARLWGRQRAVTARLPLKMPPLWLPDYSWHSRYQVNAGIAPSASSPVSIASWPGAGRRNSRVLLSGSNYKVLKQARLALLGQSRGFIQAGWPILPCLSHLQLWLSWKRVRIKQVWSDISLNALTSFCSLQLRGLPSLASLYLVVLDGLHFHRFVLTSWTCVCLPS